MMWKVALLGSSTGEVAGLPGQPVARITGLTVFKLRRGRQKKALESCAKLRYPTHMNTKLIRIGAAARRLGVHPCTLRRWDKDKSFVPVLRQGQYRWYSEEQVRNFIQARTSPAPANLDGEQQ